MMGKTLSYLHENHGVVEGPDRPARRAATNGSNRAGAGVRRGTPRSGRVSPRQTYGPSERRRRRLAARLSRKRLLRSRLVRVDRHAVTYLVDAKVLSEPTKPSPDHRVIEWLRMHETEIAVDPIILGELRFGILLLAKGKKRTALERWFDGGVQRLHCLPWEADTGLKWAELLARLRTTGKAMPIKDSLIAATALRHGLKVVTRNCS